VLVDALERRAKYPAFLLGDGRLIFIHRRRLLFEEPQQQARGPGWQIEKDQSPPFGRPQPAAGRTGAR
jgi:hypothetical protein